MTAPIFPLDSAVYVRYKDHVLYKNIEQPIATGGFREGTFAKLKYRHIKEDLEANKTPIHIHIEATITKGKYHEYDTFINTEASQLLKLYIDDRKRGNRTHLQKNSTTIHHSSEIAMSQQKC